MNAQFDFLKRPQIIRKASEDEAIAVGGLEKRSEDNAGGKYGPCHTGRQRQFPKGHPNKVRSCSLSPRISPSSR